MTRRIDARGLACPMPVVKTKRAVDAGATEFEVLVDNEAAKENVLRFAASVKATATASDAEDGGFRIEIHVSVQR